MNSQVFDKLNLPDQPGVYFWKKGKDTLYIGRATSLCDRVRSYFSHDLIATRGPLIVDMVTQSDDIEWQATDSVLEAIILEANLIKKHLPYYNTKEKDNKSFNYVVITDEEFPRILFERGRSLKRSDIPKKYKVKYVFGPFPNASMVKEALKIIRKIFPFRDRCEPGVGTPCFNRQIGLCPGVCDGSISVRDYRRTIQHLKLFFEGKKSELLKNLEREMRRFAKEREFEKANETKKTLFALTHIQDVSLIKDDIRANDGSYDTFRIEAYDVAHLSGTNMVGVMTVIENGEVNKSEYRKFRIETVVGPDDTLALQEILTRRFTHSEWRLPDMIVVDGGKAQANTAQYVLRRVGKTIPIIALTKDDKHKAKSISGNRELVKKWQKAIILANSEAHRFAIKYHRKIRFRLV